jgi:signal transduction histidine kinase
MNESGRWKRFPLSLGAVVAITAVPVLLLFAVQWYLLDRFAAVTRLVLKQASQEVASRFAARIRSDFESPMPNLVEVVPHDAVRHRQWRRVANVLDERKADFWFIDRFFMWNRTEPSRNARDTLNHAVAFYSMHPPRDGDDVVRGTSYPNHFFSDALSEPVFSKAIESANDRVNFGFTRFATNNRDYYVIFHFVYDLPDRSQLGAILGFTIDLQYLRTHYFKRVVSTDALRQMQLPGFPLPTAVIVDERRRQIYASDKVGRDDTETGEATFPALFFNVDLLDSGSPLRRQIPYWTLRSGYADMSVASFIRRQTNQQRALWLVLMLITIAGFILAVRASIQQVRLVQLKSAFVSSVSHELKTPLAKIRLFTDTLKSGRVRSAEKMQEYYDVISAQASKLERLVDGILEIARLEAGFSEFRREPVDLRSVAHDALESYEHELSRYGFRVEVALATREVMVLGDAEQLQTVVENLLSNAVKYSDGTRFISLAVKSDHKHGVVEVADRGIGMPASQLSRIFAKFYRVAQGGDAAPAGFGLGLAIVDRIMQAHGGRVVVDSDPGRGSTFRVELPIVPDSGDEHEAHIGY